MQTKKDKFLIDIYFEESKMNVWREKCIKSSEFISNKIKSKNDLISGEKNKIRSEKNSNILILKEDWNKIISEYETFSNEKENSTQLIVASICDEIKRFKKLCNSLRDNILNTNNNNQTNPSNNLNSNNFNTNAIEEFFDEIKLYKTRIPNIKNLSITFEANIEEFETFALKMKNLLIKSTVNINLVFTNYHTIKKNLLEIIDKLGKYSEGLKNLEKDFSYLLNPSYFPEAYTSSLIEIKRRIIFNKKITKDFERVKQLVVKENANRKQFIQDYGKYLTHDYVPQLKFSDLELKIDFNNQDEVLNLPNILDEAEENTINNNNLYLDYEEVNLNNNENNFLLTSNNNNNNTNNINVNSMNNININKNSSEGILNNFNNYRVRSIRKNSSTDENQSVNSISNINNNIYNNLVNLKKGISDDMNNLTSNTTNEDTLRNLNMKISEIEIMLKVKEAEIKKLFTKIEHKDRKITQMQSEIERLSSTYDSLKDNFLKQINFKEQKFRDKNIQCENLLKLINNVNDYKLESCPFCKDIAMNNLDSSGWNNYSHLKEYHEKLIDRNKIMCSLEKRFTELVASTNFLKKTFFNHINNTLEIKNKEIITIKETYENKLMHLEELLSQEKNKLEKFILANNSLKNSISNQESINSNIKLANLEDLIKSKDLLISQLEIKIRELNKQVETNNIEVRKIISDKENLEKLNKDMKIRENNLNADILLKDGKIENIYNELKIYEKNNELSKKKNEDKEKEILVKLKENSDLKNKFELQNKDIEELKKALEIIKNDHKDELKDKNKNSQYLINELNNKLDDLTKQLNEKIKMNEDQKLINQELISVLEIKNEEIKDLKDNIERISKSQQELDVLRDKMEHLESFNNNENYKLKKKLEELQITSNEKDKKLQVIFFPFKNFLFKFFVKIS